MKHFYPLETFNQLQGDALAIQLRCWLRGRAINQSAFFFQDRPEWSSIRKSSAKLKVIIIAFGGIQVWAI